MTPEHRPISELRITWGSVTDWAPPGDRPTRRFTVDAELIAERDDDVTSTILCVGKTVWPGPALLKELMVDETFRWLYETGDPDWPNHPSTLFQTDSAGAARWWGYLVGAVLHASIGPDRMDELVGAAKSGERHVRMVFRARDALAGRIPVETLEWPIPGGSQVIQQGVSVLRSVASFRGEGLELARDFGPKGGTRYRPLLLRLDESQQTAKAHEAIVTGPSDQLIGVDDARTAHGFDQLANASVDEILAADLVVLAGHGSPGEGVLDEFRSGTKSVGPWAVAQAFAGPRILPRDRPSCVVLSSCGSAEWPTHGARESSLAAEIATHGVPLVIGFQGERVEQFEAFPFVATLTRSWQETFLEHEGRDLSLADWEHALAEARSERMPASAVAYVHPETLLGRAHQPGRGRGPVKQSTVVAPFYVPGQVAWVQGEDGGPDVLRVPLPVDFGVRLVVSRGTTKMSKRDKDELPGLEPLLDQLRAAWPEAFEEGISIAIAGAGADRVAPPSRLLRAQHTVAAHFCAVVRAVQELMNEDPPRDVLDLVEEQVRRSSGSPDGQLRVIDHATGRVVRLLSDRWPAVETSLTGRGEELERPPLSRAGDWCVPEHDAIDAIVRDDLIWLVQEQQRRYGLNELLNQVDSAAAATSYWPFAVRVRAASHAGTPRATTSPADVVAADTPAVMGGLDAD